jgi:hypothetical protein
MEALTSRPDAVMIDAKSIDGSYRALVDYLDD